MYALKVVVPHEVPSVVRTQACASPVFTGPQVPVPLQSGSVRVRVWPPMLAQALPPSQTLQAVKVVLPQPTPASAKLLPGQVAAVPLQRSSTSQVEAAVRQMRLGPSRPQVPLTAAPCATLHASQASPQAELQHTPSTQKFEVHSVAAPQVTPLGFFAEQYVPLQYVFAGQPLVQRMGQSASVPLQTMAPPQAGLPGSVAGAGEQVPAVALRLQRSQLPLQAALQHTPSAQKPDWHSALEPQVAPCTLSVTQAPLLQNRPGAHCREVVQVAGHEPLTPSHA